MTALPRPDDITSYFSDLGAEIVVAILAILWHSG